MPMPFPGMDPCLEKPALWKQVHNIPIPLRPGEDEPLLPLNQILHTLYDSVGYDLFINYHQPPVPPLGDEDAVWAQQLIAAGSE